MIQLEGVWKSYQGQPALRGVTLTVGRGDALLLTGPSGAGKSTLLRLVFAAEEADRGELFVAGRNLARLSRASIPYVRRNIGVVFQDFKLLPSQTALENVAVALEILGLPGPQIRERSLISLDKVGLLHKAHARAATLSGGEQQRVAVARAIVGEPAILLCDEPTGNLDPERSRSLLELLEEIHLRGTTILIATHDPQLVDFGVEAGWRCGRLVDGELLDVSDVSLRPAISSSRPARLDEETEGFASRRDADATQHHKRLLRVVPR